MNGCSEPLPAATLTTIPGLNLIRDTVTILQAREPGSLLPSLGNWQLISCPQQSSVESQLPCRLWRQGPGRNSCLQGWRECSGAPVLGASDVQVIFKTSPAEEGTKIQVSVGFLLLIGPDGPVLETPDTRTVLRGNFWALGGPLELDECCNRDY